MVKSKKYEWDYCTHAPEKLFGVYIGYCCKEHDMNYCVADKTPISRREADNLLRDMIQHEFEINNKPILGWFVSHIYFYAVRLFGGFYYKQWLI